MLSKSTTLLLRRKREVPLLFHFMKRALPTQKREKLQGVNLFLHLSRENFEGLEQTRGYLSHNMKVTRFWYNIGSSETYSFSKPMNKEFNN